MQTLAGFLFRKPFYIESGHHNAIAAADERRAGQPNRTNGQLMYD